MHQSCRSLVAMTARVAGLPWPDGWDAGSLQARLEFLSGWACAVMGAEAGQGWKALAAYVCCGTGLRVGCWSLLLGVRLRGVGR